MGYYDRNSAFTENYSQYMEKQALMLKDLNSSIKQGSDQIKESMVCMQTGIQTAINEQISTIIASNDILNQTFQQGFNSLNNTIDMGFSGISHQLGYMSAAFSFGLDRISDTLKGMSIEICDRLDKIHDIVNNPLLTQSRELFRRAIENYNKGFFEEALEDIQAAVEKYKTDYISWFLMGKVFSFGASEFSNVINLEEAIRAYAQAAKYNSPNTTVTNDARLLSAEIYFYLGVAQYSKSNELIRGKKETDAAEMLANALKSFEQSFNYSDKMYESLFNIARCKTLQGKKNVALVDLEKLVLLDRNYCIKIFDDNDFSIINREFTDLINKLKHNYLVNEAEPRYKKIISFISEYKSYKGVDIKSFKLNFNPKKIPSKFTDDLPYFDILDYDKEFIKIVPTLDEFREQVYNKLLNRKKTCSSYDILKILEEGFLSLNCYKNSDLLAKECRESSELQIKKQEEKKLLEEREKIEQQKQEEQRRIEQQKKREQSEKWRKQGLCFYCGGQIGGVFKKKCKLCDKLC